MVYMMLYKILDLLFQGLYLVLVVRILLSWIPHNRFHPLVNMIYQVTDPMLQPFQQIVPTWKLGIDVSPIFAFIALSIIRKVVFQLLF